MQSFNYLGEEAAAGKALKKKARDSGNKIALLFLLLVIIQLSVSFLYEIVAAILLALGHTDAAGVLLSPVVLQFVVYLISLVLCILVARIFISMRQFDYHEDLDSSPLSLTLPSEKVGALDFSCAIFVCIAAGAIGNIITALIGSLLSDLDLPALDVSFGMPSSVAETVLYFISISVLPALLEEILCRGFVYQLTKGYGAFLSALVGAITFMLFHQNFAQFPLAFCFGFAIGYMLYRFKNIWIGIIAHFIVNLIACLSSLADSLWHIDENIVSLLFEIYLALVLSLGFLSLTYLIAAGKLKTTPATDRCPRALSSILLSPAYIVFTVVSIAISIFVWL